MTRVYLLQWEQGKSLYHYPKNFHLSELVVFDEWCIDLTESPKNFPSRVPRVSCLHSIYPAYYLRSCAIHWAGIKISLIIKQTLETYRSNSDSRRGQLGIRCVFAKPIFPEKLHIGLPNHLETSKLDYYVYLKLWNKSSLRGWIVLTRDAIRNIKIYRIF